MATPIKTALRRRQHRLLRLPQCRSAAPPLNLMTSTSPPTMRCCFAFAAVCLSATDRSTLLTRCRPHTTNNTIYDPDNESHPRRRSDDRTNGRRGCNRTNAMARPPRPTRLPTASVPSNKLHHGCIPFLSAAKKDEELLEICRFVATSQHWEIIISYYAMPQPTLSK